MSSDKLAAEAEQSALKAEAEHGKGSPEAKVAWDIFEEISASAGPNPALRKSLEEECDLSDSSICTEYYKSMVEIEELVKSSEPTSPEGL
ncbi:unnamed protein product [Heterosigma akashiwo]